MSKQPTVKETSAAPEVSMEKKNLVEIIIDREMTDGGIRVNGTGKGWDEYSSLSNFDYRPPEQDFFLVAPRVGVTASWPVHCQLPDEPWAKKTKNKTSFAC